MSQQVGLTSLSLAIRRVPSFSPCCLFSYRATFVYQGLESKAGHLPPYPILQSLLDVVSPAPRASPESSLPETENSIASPEL